MSSQVTMLQTMPISLSCKDDLAFSLWNIQLKLRGQPRLLLVIGEIKTQFLV